VATLVAPADCQWEEAGGPRRVAPAAAPAAVPGARVEAVAARLRASRGAALLLGGPALREEGLRAASRVARACAARLWCETFPARLERGGGLPAAARLPYFPEQAAEALAACDSLVLVGAREPVAFFGYRDGPSRLAPAGSCIALAAPAEDAAGALCALAETLGADARPGAPAGQASGLPGAPTGALDPASLGAVLARALPEGAVVVDEGATSGAFFWALADAAARHSVLTLTGGAIGQGLPCATGAALACPERRVIALQADGSGLYTAQALWTQAREALDVVTVVCANRRYRILQIELARAGIAEPGRKALALTELSHPVIDWVALAGSFGVPAVRVDSAEGLARELDAALAERGPRLLEAVL
jgi:acetolactate synthase-1/2/3 large subunit